jgi:hypothetical protein
VNDDARSAPQLVLQPVALTPELTADATGLLTMPIRLASKLVPQVDAELYKQLVVVVLELMLERQCEFRGIAVHQLTERAEVSRSRLDEKFGAPWQHFTDVVVRAVALETRRDTLYEELYSVPVTVRRGDNSLATDKHEGFHNSLHVLVRALASIDHHCPTLVRPLTTGTRDDRTCERADPRRIDQYQKQLGGWLPGNMAENVKSLLQAGYYELPGARGRSSFDRVLSPYLLVGSLPYGPPSSSHLYSQGTLLPGRDPEIVSTVYDCRRRGVLYAGTPAAQETADGMTLGIDRTFRRWPIKALPEQDRLNIIYPFGVDYLWSPVHRLLVRELRDLTEFWRLVNFTEELLPYAVALIERHAQHEWPAGCLSRWAAECAPGLVGARHPITRQGLVDLLNAANVAAVAAERRSRQPRPAA